MLLQAAYPSLFVKSGRYRVFLLIGHGYYTQNTVEDG